MRNKESDFVNMKAIHKHWAEKDYPMTSGCCLNGGVYGLITGHAYSLLDIKDITHNGDDVTIIKMRNPWNSEKYKGPWRDNDPNWTPALKEKVGLVEANDGAFWMPYTTFLKYFYNVAAALYQPYKYSQLKVNAVNRQYTVTITNPVKQHLFITGEMYSSRHFPRNCNP